MCGSFNFLSGSVHSGMMVMFLLPEMMFVLVFVFSLPFSFFTFYCCFESWHDWLSFREIAHSIAGGACNRPEQTRATVGRRDQSVVKFISWSTKFKIDKSTNSWTKKDTDHRHTRRTGFFYSAIFFKFRPYYTFEPRSDTTALEIDRFFISITRPRSPSNKSLLQHYSKNLKSRVSNYEN